MESKQIERKLSMIWEVLMAMAQKTFTDPDLQDLLDKLLLIEAQYKEPISEDPPVSKPVES